MMENTLFRGPINLVEVVHVELSNEGAQAFVSKVKRQSVRFKLLFILNFEGTTVPRPPEKVWVQIRGTDFE